MEDDEVFDAGYGSHLNAEGEVELDAGFMDGHDMQVGAVAAVKKVRNPIRVARAVMERSEPVLIVAEGAHRFAERMGIETCLASDLVVPREMERWQALQAQEEFSHPADLLPVWRHGGRGGARPQRADRGGHFYPRHCEQDARLRR
jgi:isoaspartyl peptidase/L-asparaginase-like protein (Ntn-hydrolase superfamily)